MKTMKLKTFLGFSLLLLSFSNSGKAAYDYVHGDTLWVKEQDDLVSSDSGYGNSIRAQFKTLETADTLSGYIGSLYLDKGTDYGNGFVPMDSDGIYPRNWIWVDTTKVLVDNTNDGVNNPTDNGIHVDKIEFLTPLTLNVQNYTVFGNPSEFASQEVTDTGVLIDKNNSTRSAQYSADAVTVLEGYDAGTITLDFRTNFKDVDFYKADADGTVDDEGSPVAAKNGDDIDWSKFPLQCSSSSEKVALWNTVILLPDSFDGKNRNNSYELKKVIFDSARPETKCLVDFGAVYVCVGTRKNIAGINIDPNTITDSAGSISDQNDSWCDAKATTPSFTITPFTPGDFLQNYYWPDVDQDSFGANGEGVYVNPRTGTIPTDVNGNPYIGNAGDCLDTEAAAYPGNTEICDEIDNDCDGHTDEVLSSDGTAYETVCPDTTIYYEDNDGDTYGGDVSTVPTTVTIGGDCDDTEVTAFPGNPESCDGIDNDCNGIVDDITTGSCDDVIYDDNDGDGVGDEVSTDGTGVSVGGDCDDTDANNFPGNPEVCDGQDNNCDGVIDGATICTDFYDDIDGDGYGDDSTAHDTEDANDVAIGGDCDVDNADVNPGATEICGNSIDEDCSGADLDCTIFYDDADDDGFGDDGTAHDTQDDNDVTVGGDCDDTNPNIHPDAVEICSITPGEGNGVDENCDGTIDEGCAIEICTDGFDNNGNGLQDCDDTAACDCSDVDQDGYTVVDGDCNDSNENIHPGAAEFCNGLDNDCDGVINDDNVCIDGANPDIGDFGSGFVEANGGVFGFAGCSLQTSAASSNSLDAELAIAAGFALLIVTLRRRATH